MTISQPAAADAGSVVRAADASIAAIHSDIAFALTTGPRKTVLCDGDGACAKRPDWVMESYFDAKVRDVATILEGGVRELFPGMSPQRAGTTGLFDVFVVDAERWDTASSASGKIAISSAIGAAYVTDDLLAFLIAREMAHIVARHHEQNSTASILTSLAMNVLVPGSGLIKSAISWGGATIASNSNREAQERQADDLAALILKASGYKIENVLFAMALLRNSPDKALWAPHLLAFADNMLTTATRQQNGTPRNMLPGRAAVAPSAVRKASLPVVTYAATGSTVFTSPQKLERKVLNSATSLNGATKLSSYYDGN